MAIVNSETALQERELTVHQRNLVDTCFEEGQYEAAIAVLDEVRSRKYKPFPAHVRQIVYIALYPPPSLEDQLEEEALKLEPGSPSKLLSRRHKSSLAPSQGATTAAQRLLMKLARTNAAESLACALPHYPDNPNLPLRGRIDEEDSYIAQQALRVCNARSCWEIVKEGFIQRGIDGDVIASPRKSGTRRSMRLKDDDNEAWEGDALAPVSDHAWVVLDCLITLFENNETVLERTEQVRYSPLLLRQIPPSRADKSPRWDVEMPLDVAFHALQQSGEARRSLGVRLLVLLINLTSTTLLDFPMFLNAVSNRVSSLPIDALQYLFDSLPATQAVDQFRVMLCRHALGGSQVPTGKSKPQARARAQPRRRMRTTTTDTAGDTGADALDGVPQPVSAQPHSAPTGQDSVAGGAPSVARKYPSISASDVLDLLARPNKTDSASIAARTFLKNVLVIDYARLQQNASENDRDAGWLDVLRDGSLKRAVEDAFDTKRAARATDTSTMEFVQETRGALLTLMSMW